MELSNNRLRRAFFYLLLPSFIIPPTTVIVLFFGPKPYVETSMALGEGYSGTIEHRDNYAVLSWWIITAAIGLLAFFMRTNSAHNRPNNRQSIIGSVLGLTSIVFLSASYLLTFDLRATGNFGPATLSQLAVGATITGLAILLIAHPLGKSARIHLVLAAVYLPIFVFAFWQSPGGLREIGHFPYLANELAAAATSRPLVDFAPQYSSLLGIPIAPFLSSSSNGIALMVGWLLVIQIATVLVPVVTATRIAGSRLIIPSIMALSASICALVIDASSLVSSTSIFSFAARHVIPSLLLAVLIFALYPRSSRTLQFVVGAVAALATINNPDFGATAALASVITLLLYASKGQTLRTFIPWVIGYLYGLIVLLLILTRFSPTAFRLDLLTLFPRVFGSAGFAKEPMSFGGWHVAYVCFFSTSVVLGVLMRYSNDLRTRAGSVFLLYASLWGLLTMPYFAGRSFTSTLTGGHSYQVALTIVGYLVLIAANPGLLRMLSLKSNFPAFSLAVIVLVNMVVAFSFVSRFPSTSDSAAIVQSTSLDEPRYQAIKASTTKLTDRFSVLGIESLATVGQAIEYSNFIEMDTSIQSVLPTSHPIYSATSTEVASLYCSNIRSSGIQYIVEDSSTPTAIGQSCSDLRLQVIATQDELRISRVIILAEDGD